MSQKAKQEHIAHIYTHIKTTQVDTTGGEVGVPQQELGRIVGLGAGGSETIPTPSATCYRECLRGKE